MQQARKGTDAVMKKYRVLTKKHLAVATLVAFLTAVALILLAAAIPYMYANATAAAQRRLPICCTDRSDKVVSLTFDAAWGDEDTPQLIELLKRYDVKATFFVTGDWVDRCENSVRALHEAGHEVMNNSNTHANMPKLTRDRMIAEINTCSDKIQAVTGVRPTLFRAPYGDYDNALLETLETMRMSCIQWDVDALDWKDLSAQDITKRVVNGVQSGSIVLFHSAARNTPEALPHIIEQLREKGYRFVPVSEMIYTEGYILNSEGRQIADARRTA